MDFLRSVLTEKNTYTASAPKKTIVKMTKGLITGGWLYFPTGPAGLLHLVVKKGNHQVYPIDAGNDYALNDCVIPLSGGLFLAEPPFQLTVCSWNTSTAYDHTLTLCLFLDPAGEEPAKKANWFNRIFSNGKQKE